jgi:hypothetical protein
MKNIGTLHERNGEWSVKYEIHDWTVRWFLEPHFKFIPLLEQEPDKNQTVLVLEQGKRVDFEVVDIEGSGKFAKII